MEILKILLPFFFLLVSFSAWSKHFETACSLLNWEGKVEKTFPGSMCAYLDDGRVVSATETEMRMLGPNGEVQWSLPGNFHHQVNLSEDQKRILTLSYDFRTEDGLKTRYDTFVVVSLDGKVLAEKSFKGMTEKSLRVKLSDTFSHLNAEYENSHFNSIFEVGKLDKNVNVPWLKEGNVIVNGLIAGVYVLSSDLKEVLHHFTVPTSQNHMVHDVKVLSNGNILLFNNANFKPKDRFPQSALQELNPVTLKPVFSFIGEYGIPLYSKHCGGVQKIDDDHYLYSLMYNGGYIVNRKSGKVIRNIHEANFVSGRLWVVQNLRLLELSETFRKVHSLK